MGTQFKKGDLVRLKSGGPDMTIDELYPPRIGNDASARCVWFAGKKHEFARFDLATLVPAAKQAE